MTPSARRPRHARQPRHSPKALLLATAAVVLVVVVAGVVGGIAFTRTAAHAHSATAPTKSDAPAATPTPAPAAQLLSWLQANVAPTAVIVTDPASVTTLRAAGFSAVSSYADSAAQPLSTIEYLLWRPGTPTTARVASLLAASLPLAVFGSSDDAPSIRQVFADGASAARLQQSTDAALRGAGGRQLTQNSRITLDPASRADLEQGRLDLRAENVSTVLAAAGPIWLTIAAQDPAEQRAGLPARTVTVTVTNSGNLQVLLASLTAPFRPATVTTIGPNKVQLTWSPRIAPVVIGGG